MCIRDSFGAGLIGVDVGDAKGIDRRAPGEARVREVRSDLLQGAAILRAVADDQVVACLLYTSFVQVFADQQGGRALLALLQQASVDVLRRANVQPARRLGGNDDLRPARDLAGQDELLDVAAGEALGRRLQRGRLDAIAPVSYTHLDVYKRQTLVSVNLKYFKCWRKGSR